MNQAGINGNLPRASLGILNTLTPSGKETCAEKTRKPTGVCSYYTGNTLPVQAARCAGEAPLK